MQINIQENSSLQSKLSDLQTVINDKSSEHELKLQDLTSQLSAAKEQANDYEFRIERSNKDFEQRTTSTDPYNPCKFRLHFK